MRSFLEIDIFENLYYIYIYIYVYNANPFLEVLTYLYYADRKRIMGVICWYWLVFICMFYCVCVFIHTCPLLALPVVCVCIFVYTYTQIYVCL